MPTASWFGSGGEIEGAQHFCGNCGGGSAGFAVCPDEEEETGCFCRVEDHDEAVGWASGGMGAGRGAGFGEGCAGGES